MMVSMLVSFSAVEFEVPEGMGCLLASRVLPEALINTVRAPLDRMTLLHMGPICEHLPCCLRVYLPTTF